MANKTIRQDDDVVDGKAVTEKERRVAKEIANYYLAICRVRNSYSRILPIGMKPEESRFWANFVKTAREVIDLDANPHGFVMAQFDKVAWKKTIPYPSQLHSQSCVIAYMEWAERNLFIQSRVQTSEETMTEDPFERESRKLEQWSEKFGVSRKRILRENQHEFSDAFLRKYGVTV